ncbi:phosphatase PAP2 family protein [Lichenifustis flavocetrariae]|uniref:Phosphatase PAP2 family protein n=1 Tax=Lichenifustis flavocetrariae TaxID=2949735 RepID=A0AA41YUF6_9HYPH|nr:phosphatase PAP2 family protein [Lichenifustis flavocetrariae]MCW6508334.1 phosphatase PAP2 family protein [Lichenifustis flavocetrariae]
MFASARNLFGRMVAQGSEPALAASALFAIIIAVGLVSGTIGYRAELDDVVIVLVGMWLCGLACQLFGLRCIGQGTKAVAIFFIMSTLAAAASAVLAKISWPYADDTLNAWDRVLLPGFDWPSTMMAINQHPAVMAVLSRAYSSLNWQPALLLFVFCMVERSDQAWRILSVLALALVPCLLIFPFCPALAGYAHFRIPRAAVRNVGSGVAWRAPMVLDGLRNGQIQSLGIETLGGLITMPSFHAASAIILGWGAWASRWLRWPTALLNVIMFVSAVPISGHYVVDVLAGGIIALLAIKVSTARDGRSIATWANPE